MKRENILLGFIFVFFLSTLLIAFGLLYSDYNENVSYNQNIINFQSNIKNHSIILTTCKDIICYDGRIVVNVNETICYFGKIIDPIYQNVENWLNKYYPIKTNITVSFNIKERKCDNYKDESTVGIILLSCIILYFLLMSLLGVSEYYKNKSVIFEI